MKCKSNVSGLGWSPGKPLVVFHGWIDLLTSAVLERNRRCVALPGVSCEFECGDDGKRVRESLESSSSSSLATMDPRHPPASVVLPSQAQVHQVHVQGYSQHPAHQHQHQHQHQYQYQHQHQHPHHSHSTSSQTTNGGLGGGQTGLEAYKTTDYTTATAGSSTTGGVVDSSSSSASAAAAALAEFDTSTPTAGGNSCLRETGTPVGGGGVAGSQGIDLLRGTASTGGSRSIGATNHSTSNSSSRQPLSDTTGNARHHSHHSHHSHHHAAATAHHHQPHHYPAGQHQLPSLTTTRSCLPSSATSLSSLTGPLAPPPTIPTPPILPTQTLSSNISSASSHHNHNHHAVIGGGGSSSTPSSSVAAGTSSSNNNSSSSLRLRRHQVMIQRRNRNPIYDCPEFAQYRLKQKEKDKQVWPDVLEHAFLDGKFSPGNDLRGLSRGLGE